MLSSRDMNRHRCARDEGGKGEDRKYYDDRGNGEKKEEINIWVTETVVFVKKDTPINSGYPDLVKNSLIPIGQYETKGLRKRDT